MSTLPSTAGAGVSLSRRRIRLRRPQNRNLPESEAPTGTTASLRHQRPYAGGPGFGREHELQEVIQDVEQRLAAIARIKTPEYDERLGEVEAVAAPYVISFLYEIRRLEALLRRRAVR